MYSFTILWSADQGGIAIEGLLFVPVRQGTSTTPSTTTTRCSCRRLRVWCSTQPITWRTMIYTNNDLQGMTTWRTMIYSYNDLQGMIYMTYNAPTSQLLCTCRSIRLMHPCHTPIRTLALLLLLLMATITIISIHNTITRYITIIGNISNTIVHDAMTRSECPYDSLIWHTHNRQLYMRSADYCWTSTVCHLESDEIVPLCFSCQRNGASDKFVWAKTTRWGFRPYVANLSTQLWPHAHITPARTRAHARMAREEILQDIE